MSTITTHVLDTVLGKPAAGIAVRLEQAARAMRLRCFVIRCDRCAMDAAAILLQMRMKEFIG